MSWLARLTILLALSASSVAGYTFKSALMTDISNLGSFAEMYHDSEGMDPASWTEFEDRFGPVAELCSVLDSYERFAFVTEPVSLLGDATKERIVFISRDPFRPPTKCRLPVLNSYYSSVGENVYVAAVQRGERVFLRKVTPEQAARAFAEAGVSLPSPSVLGLFPHERTHRIRTIAVWIGTISALVWGAWRIAKRGRRSCGGN